MAGGRCPTGGKRVGMGGVKTATSWDKRIAFVSVVLLSGCLISVAYLFANLKKHK